MFPCGGFYYPSIREHHPERLSAKALGQAKIEDGKHADDNSQSNECRFSRKRAVYDRNKSEKRDRADGYGKKVGSDGYYVAEYRSALVAPHQLAGEGLVYLSDLCFEVVHRIDFFDRF